MFHDNFRSISAAFSVNQGLIKSVAIAKAFSAIDVAASKVTIPSSYFNNTVLKSAVGNSIAFDAMKNNNMGMLKQFSALSPFLVKYNEIALSSSKLHNALGLLDLQRNAMFGHLQKYDLINRMPTSLLVSLNTSVNSVIDRSVKEEDYESIEVINDVFEEITDFLSGDLTAKFKAATKRLNEKATSLLKNDVVVILLLAVEILRGCIDGHSYYMQLNSEAPLTKKEAVMLHQEAEEKATKRYNALMSHTDSIANDLNKKIELSKGGVCIKKTNIYFKAYDTNRVVGEVTEGQVVTITSTNVEWMIITFENDNGESVSGWVLREHFQ